MCYNTFMDIKHILIIILLSASTLWAKITPTELMTEIYGKYDTKNKCWHNDEYCMTIDSVKNLNCDTGKRMYLLAIGYFPNPGHGNTGAIGTFIVENQNGKDIIIAQNKKIEIGSNGNPPTEWKLVKLAPSDYWGWMSIFGDIHQGYFNAWYSILAPYGKTIKEIGTITQSANNSGAIDINQYITELDGTLYIDDHDKSVKIYPIFITMHGIKEGEKIQSKKYKVPFDFKKWKYQEPKGMIPSY